MNRSSKGQTKGNVWLAAGIAVLVLACTGLSNAQDHRWTGDVGAGYTPLVGAISSPLDDGWHITFSAGYNVTDKFSLSGRFLFTGLGVNPRVLREAAVPNGDARVWALTLEPRVRLAPSENRFVPYLVGGVGYYRRTVEFTEPTVQAVTIFDPFFGFGSVLVPANQVIGSIVRDGIGGNAGLGFEFRIGDRNTKLFTEARYHYADNGGAKTQMVPLTLGVRF